MLFIYMTLYLISWEQGNYMILMWIRMHYICIHSTSRVTNPGIGRYISDIVHKFDHGLKCGLVVCTRLHLKRLSPK